MDYFKFLRQIDKSNKTLFDIPVVEQRTFLEKFAEPKDDWQRSYYQYKCQMYFSPWWLKMIQNIIAMVAYPFVLIYFLLKPSQKCNVEADTVISMDGIHSSLIPKEIIGLEISTTEGACLSLRDIGFCLYGIFRYFYAPFFNFKLLFKLAQYRYVIEKYEPKAIVVHSEFSFCCSALTCYCNKQDIQHIDMMHGEKLYYIRDTFFRFDKCYVWDDYYVKLFKELRAEQTQFFVSTPPSLIFDTSQFLNNECYADYKYYLASQKEEEIYKIVEMMKLLQSKGKSIMFRPHPRYTNVKYLSSLIDSQFIEDNKNVSIEQSISNCTNVISGYSTVLQQGHYAGKKIILDDVTYPQMYQQLTELKYIMTTLTHEKLSAFI